MKIRNGFVSNSSSSSFVIVGKIIPLSTLNEALLNNKDGTQYMFQSTLDGGEATTYGEINDVQMLKYLKKHSNLVDTVYEVYAFAYDGSEIDLSTVKVPKGKKAFVYGGEMSQHCICDVEELKEYWPDECPNDDEDEYNDTPPTGKKAHIRLECTVNGHYKFYEMKDLSNGTFEARYGKIGTDGRVYIYNISAWAEKYEEKIKEEYVQVF